MKKKFWGPKFSGFDPWTGHRGDPSPLNISGTDENFDTRSSRGSQDRSPLHSDQVSSKSLEPFFRKSRKTIILTIFSTFWMNQIFPGKSGFVSLLPLLSYNFMPSFGKILWPVIEKSSGLTNGRTDGHGSIYRTNLQSRWVQKRCIDFLNLIATSILILITFDSITGKRVWLNKTSNLKVGLPREKRNENNKTTSTRWDGPTDFVRQ